MVQIASEYFRLFFGRFAMLKSVVGVVITAMLLTGCGNSTPPVYPGGGSKTQTPGGGGSVSDPGNGSGGSSGQTGPGGSSSGGSADNGGSSSGSPIVTRSVSTFTIRTKNKEDLNTTTGINNFHLILSRGDTTLFDSDKNEQSGYSVNVTQESTLVITSKEPLHEGDVVTLEASGYTPQQRVIDRTMLQAAGMQMMLKPIGSRQVFTLGDLSSGRVTTRYAMGASTHIRGGGVTFQTADKSVTLKLGKSQFARIAKRVARTTKANKDTKIFLDITTVDPKTEPESAIGDFTFDTASEPENSRSRAVSDADTMLESVVMASLSMTTSEGEEIHCFDGSAYDEANDECSGDGSTATLKMKIPASQFAKYARKYNKGERTVPLYHYSKAKATWVRQMRGGQPADGALVLDDANDNGIADAGDTLYISGEVTHFSYWNGDYPRESIALHGTIEVAEGSHLPQGTVVEAKGGDYTGRIFRAVVDGNGYTGLRAKKDAKVEIYLKYPDGTKSKSIYVTTGDEDQEITQKLVCDYKTQPVTVTVTDTENHPLEGAIVQGAGKGIATDAEGHAQIDISKNAATKVTAYYDAGDFTTKTTKLVTPDDTTIRLDLRRFTMNGNLTFTDADGNALDFRDGYVSVRNDEGTFYNVVNIKGGKYQLNIPLAQLHEGSTLYLEAGIFVPLYAKYITKTETLTLTAAQLKNKALQHDFAFTLQPFIVSGRVINPFAPAGEKGIANIIVYTDSQSVTTDENGYYKMVLFYKEGGQKIHAYDPVNGDIVRPDVITIAENEQNEDHKDLDFVIDRRSATITGSVINEKGIPVEGVSVYTGYGWLSATTDAEGKFTITIDKSDLMGIEEMPLYIYDATDANKLLTTQTLTSTIERGATLNAGEIRIDTNIAPVIRSVRWDEPIVGQPMNIYVDAYDPDNNKLRTEILYDGQTVEVKEGIATITPQQSGKLTFITKVEETDGDLFVTSKQSMIVSENAKPVIDRVSGVQKVYNMQNDMHILIAAHDPEGAKLYYRARLYNDFGEQIDAVQVEENNITVSKNIFSGNYRLVIGVSDGIDEVEKTILFRADNNVAPANLTVKVNDQEFGDTLYLKSSDQPVALIAHADDANGDTLQYTWRYNDALATADGATLTIDPSGKVGIFDIGVSVTDGREYISKSFTVVIENDLRPVIESVTYNPRTLIKAGDTLQDINGNPVNALQVHVEAYDPEGTTLSYEFGDIGSVLDVKGFGADANHTYDIRNLDTGRHAFKVVVKDEAGKTASKRVVFDIVEDRPPLIKQFFVPVKAKAGEMIRLEALAEDPEKRAVSYHWSAKNDAGTLPIADTNRSTATLQIPQNATGKITVTLGVDDGKNATVKRERTIEIVTNRAPQITQVKVVPQTVKAGKSVQFSALAYDPDLDPVTFRWMFDNKIVSDKSSGVITLEQNMTSGTYPLKLTVSDGQKERNETVAINVVAPAAKPVVTLEAAHTQIPVGGRTEISAGVNVKSRLKWQVSEGGHIYPKTGGAEFTAQQPGSYTVTVVATNEDGIKGDPATMTIEVKPVVLKLEANKPIQKVGSTFVIDASLNDDTYTIPTDAVWKVEEKPEGAQPQLRVDGTKATVVPDKEGTYKISLAFEIDGAQFAQSIAIVASADNVTDEAHSVHGIVMDQAGNVISGAYVRLYNANDPALYDMTVQTDETGAYQFTNLEAGTYYLVVSGGDGFVSQTQVVIIK